LKVPKREADLVRLIDSTHPHSCAQLYYDAKLPKEEKVPAFGMGERFGQHMMIKTDAPSPQRYSVPSMDFSPNRSKGHQFGISREKFDKVFIKEHLR
jgi:hypothetical protein